VGGHPKRLAKGIYAGFNTNQENNSVINLILLPLVFLTNRSPAVANGGRNGIHHQRRAPQKYE
jgi:hypothetical protein